MPVLNTADALYLDGAAVDAVYLEGERVWPPPVYEVHQFTGPSRVQVLTKTKVEYLIVAGGGGGATGYGGVHGGGGGAGGVLVGTVEVTPGVYPVAVGAGGFPFDGTTAGGMGGNGGNSSVFGQVAIGGGASRVYGNGQPSADGGSGGGGTYWAPLSGSDPGKGTPGQGHDGGAGSNSPISGGGGGGAGSVGQYGPDGGNGGDGITTTIRGVPEQIGGGGAGAPTGVATAGGGGYALPGVNGTGGGGGGRTDGWGTMGTRGGSGLVVLKAVEGSVVKLFGPRDIAGLDAWLEASSLGGPDGAPVQSWPDSSGNGRDATQITAANQPTLATVGGKRVVRFDGPSHYVTLASMVHLAAAEVFLVAKTDNDPAISDPTTGLWNLSANGQNTHYPYTDGNLYDGALSSTRYTVGNLPESLASWRIYDVASSPSEWTARIDGRVAFGPTANTFSVTATPTLGVDTNTGYAMLGHIAEFLVYDHILTTTERSQIESYLRTKWALP